MHGTNDGTRHIKGYGIESFIAFFLRFFVGVFVRLILCF